MQKISEILNSPTAPAETGARASSRPTTSDAGNWIWSNDERAADLPDTPAPVPCEFCGAMRYHKASSSATASSGRHTGPRGAPAHRL